MFLTWAHERSFKKKKVSVEPWNPQLARQD